MWDLDSREQSGLQRCGGSKESQSVQFGRSSIRILEGLKEDGVAGIQTERTRTDGKLRWLAPARPQGPCISGYNMEFDFNSKGGKLLESFKQKISIVRYILQQVLSGC